MAWSAGGMHSTLLLLQASQKWQSGLLVSIPRICPNCACTQLFLVSYSFFVFPYSRILKESCFQHCRVPGPSLSQLWSVYQCQFCCLFRRIAWGCLEPWLGWIVVHFGVHCERTPCLIREVSAMLVAPGVFANPAARFYNRSLY